MKRGRMEGERKKMIKREKRTTNIASSFGNFLGMTMFFDT